MSSDIVVPSPKDRPESFTMLLDQRFQLWWRLALTALMLALSLAPAAFITRVDSPPTATPVEVAAAEAPVTVSPAAAVAVTNFPYPGTGRSLPLVRLTPDVSTYLAGRKSIVGVAVYNAVEGISYGWNAHIRVRSASTVKLGIMATLLDQVQRRGRPITITEHKLLAGMIQRSDNDAADALLDRVGGISVVEDYLRAIGLTETSGDPDAWGFTLTTPSDLARLMALLSSRQILSPELCDEALALLSGVVPEQRWGLSAGLPAGAQVLLKNGWYPEQDGSVWRVHSVGSVGLGGRQYVMAVLTEYPQVLGMGYGVDTVAGIAARVAGAILDR